MTRTHPTAASWAPVGDPEIDAVLAAEYERQMTTLQLIASENFASPAVMAATGSVLTNKVQRGLSAPSLLRRQRQRRHRRAARHRPSEGALRRGARKRAAPRRLAGQRSRVPGTARHRRHGDGHEPRPRRPPHPRLAGERQRQALQLRQLRRHAQRRADRLRGHGRSGPRASAQADRGRGDGVSAPHRPGAVPRRLRRDRRGIHVRRRAHRRLDCRGRASEPGALCRPSSRSPRTRPCAARAAARSCVLRSTPSASTPPCSPAVRAGRSTTR